jgi:hypothetical protein
LQLTWPAADLVARAILLRARATQLNAGPLGDDRNLESLVLFADLSPQAQKRIEIYGVDGELIIPDWVAISHSPPRYILYFLRNTGEIVDFVQRDTLDEVVAEAHHLAGVCYDEWKACNVVVRDVKIPRATVA